MRERLRWLPCAAALALVSGCSHPVPGNASLGIAEFEVAEGATHVSITGVDADGAEVGHVILDVTATGRAIDIEFGKTHLMHESDGHGHLDLPYLPTSAEDAQLNEFLADQHVAQPMAARDVTWISLLGAAPSNRERAFDACPTSGLHSPNASCGSTACDQWTEDGVLWQNVCCAGQGVVVNRICNGGTCVGGPSGTNGCAVCYTRESYNPSSYDCTVWDGFDGYSVTAKTPYCGDGICTEPAGEDCCTCSQDCTSDIDISCFVGGTPVTMSDGSTRAIESIKIGDAVMAYDTATGRTVPARVSQTFIHENAADSTVLVNGSLQATPNHPFYANGRWVRADQLSAGDTLITLASSGGAAMMATLPTSLSTIQALPGRQTVYNLEVDGLHDYFAGGVLVHNKWACNPDYQNYTCGDGGQIWDPMY